MKCPYCQAENVDTAKFCIECGKQLNIESICPNCQHTNKATAKFCEECGHSLTGSTPIVAKEEAKYSEPTSFLNDRYQVKKKLGEGGKKKVYLVHDKKLDRDAAFALIKTENLDEDSRKRVTREARAMGKLGDNPHIVSIFDTGEINDQPYIIIPVMGGGDVEALIEKAPDHKLPLDQTISIAKAVCQGLIFAHSKGVIHRDLKPGNVWLTDGGTAKIGDFGLAVMTDVSRLTMEGMMVGTVSYMPPEQAMGGEVTAKADLYSLGAMLYEMVTGRPPFVGDDSVSIIGQHINTQPISPTWHRADLPPAFESLIMLLLEKDPEKRPASAKDVLTALESIEKGDIKESTVETQAPTENPVYRRIFVGRENELKTLQNAFTGAMSGQGALMMVVGEPGIGKTAICEQLSTFVTLRGGMTLWGHCYEEGSLSLPYLAFVEAIRSYVLDREVDELKKELGSGATDVARIVSEVREKLHVEPREAQNPEEDRYRLMQAVTAFLANAASVKPMLVILEDLHDADKGTLEMLSYVSRNLAGARLLLVGTYRDIEVDRNHPLSAALAELRRMSSYGRVLLRGLNVDEVRRMLARINNQEIPVGLAEAVHRQTEGNPLFVQEVVRYLTEEKLLITSGSRIKTSDLKKLEMNIPEGLRDVIGKRLSKLSVECNKLLSVASVIGREFAIDTLKNILDMNEDDFVNALKEAVQLSILEDRSQVGRIRYRFTHAFFRQTLYEELIAPERLKFHQQVARSMEVLYVDKLEEHATELAEHFSHSTDSDDLKKAVDYGEKAAKKALDVFACSEAVRLLDEAIRVQRVLDPDNKEKLCNLLLALCDSLLKIVDIRRIIDVEAPEAFRLAENIGDNDRIVRSCMYALQAIMGNYGFNFGTTPEFELWAKRADKYAEDNTIQRVIATTAVAWIKCHTGEAKAGLSLFRQAFKLGHALGSDPNVLALPANGLFWYLRLPQYCTERLQLAEEMWGFQNTLTELHKAYILQWIADTYLSEGRRDRFEEVKNELLAYSELTGLMGPNLWVQVLNGVTAVLDGHFEEAITISEEILNWGKAEQLESLAFMTTIMFVCNAQIYLNRSLDTVEQAFSSSPNVFLCLVKAILGKTDEAAQILDDTVVKRPDIGTDEDDAQITFDVLALQASVLIKHKKAAKLLYNRLESIDLCLTGWAFPTCIPHHLGGAAALLGRYNEAREHYKDSFRICTEINFRPELALTHLNFAELLLDHFPKEKAEAIEHLDFAIKEFREMKMQLSLERALRRKDILKA
ncbi:MAG TPA: protein kinase [Dehalococcoidia bacterium]|nr:protein kinase [Dehalococcoidia bacterium]